MRITILLAIVITLTVVVAIPASVLQSALALTLVDQSSSGRPIADATIVISDLPATLTTGLDGSADLYLAPAGMMDITVTWKSKYNPEAVTIARSSIILDKTLVTTIFATVYDAELQLVTQTGKPIGNAQISLSDVPLGVTGADGKVLATQVPSWYNCTHISYPVTATWLGVDISPGEVVITTTKTYVLTAKNVATLTVHVVGAQGQGLNAAQVEIKNYAGTTVFSGIANEQGFTSIELPYGTYEVRVDYKGFTNAASAIVSTPTGTVQTIAANVFVEVLGLAMTFSTFVLWIAVFVLLVLALAVSIHEYHIWRRKRLPSLFGVPRATGA